MMHDLALVRRLLQRARPYWLHLASLFAVGLLASPIALLTPVPLKIVVDSVLGSLPLPPSVHELLPAALTRSPGALLALAVGLLLAIAALGQLQALGNKFMQAYVGERLVLDFRTQLVQQAQRLSLSYHDSKGAADSLYRIQQDAAVIDKIMVEAIIPFITAAITLGTMIVVIVRLDWVLALVALAVCPPLFAISRLYRPRMRRQSRHVKKLESAALAVVQETLGALRIVKAFGQEVHETDRFVRRSSEGVAARIRLALLAGHYGMLVGLTSALGTGAVLLIGVQHVRADVLSLGQLLMVLTYLGQLYDPLRMISKKAGALQSYLASAERAFALLDEQPDVPERPDARPLARAQGAVAFRAVSFAYGPDRPVLHDVSFAIAPGTQFGIVGATGAGKTTLISLLTRFYDPVDGAILLDGTDLRDYRLADLRRQFAVVPQEPVLFSVSIAENIAYAAPGASRDEIVAAAQAANAHEFITRLPQGYDTEVGERGVKLSGGQRQRIALARAFLKDSPVLILDEPTSAVDAQTEAGILDALERLKRGRTVILITHRPAMLDRCTALLALENGRVVVDTTRPLAVAPPAAARDRRSLLLGHPAVQAWGRLSPDRPVPHRVSALKVKPGRRRKTAVYRLEGVGCGTSAVIAKKCARETAEVERAVYEDVLASLDLPLLRYYGCVGDPDGEYTWLFVEEATGEDYSHMLGEHRALAGRWLGRLHAASARLGARGRLPDAGPTHYLRHVRSARERMQEHLKNPVLSHEDVAFLEGLIARLDELEEGWGLLEEGCDGVPKTLVHGDFNGKNMRLRSAQDGIAILVYDWEDAGWGVPAADLAQLVMPSSRLSANPDLSAYWSVVGEQWHDSGLPTVRRLGHCGTVFRAVAAVDWDSKNLAYDWADWHIKTMRLYEAEMAHALDELGWARRPIRSAPVERHAPPAQKVSGP
jgi:ATP-binding cassette subfamily B protein